MSMLCQQDADFQQQHNFQLVIEKLPGVVYSCTSVDVPGISSQSVDVQTPFAAIPYGGSTASYDFLTIRFLLSESWANYISIKNWIEAITFPQDYGQHTLLTESGEPLADPSDCTLNIFDNSNRLSRVLDFKNVFPVSISGFNLSTQITDPQPITLTASFKYLYFSVR